MLANIRGTFSEHEIGDIAVSLINQLKFLHINRIIYKFLTPQNIVVSNSDSFRGKKIELRITDIAMMQLIDVSDPQYGDKIQGLDRLFLAPELLNKPYQERPKQQTADNLTEEIKDEDTEE